MNQDPSSPPSQESPEQEPAFRLQPEPFDHHNTATGEPAEAVIGTQSSLTSDEIIEESFAKDSSHSQASLRTLRRPIAYTSILLVSLIVGLIFYNLNRERKSGAQEVKILANIDEERNRFDDLIVEDYQTVNQQLLETVIGFVSATSLDQRYEHSRKHPLLRQRMEAFYDKFSLYYATISNRNVQIKEPSIIEGIRFFDITVQWPGLGPVPLAARQTENGYLIDWESAEVWQPADWQEFLDGKIPEPLAFRVEVNPDDYFFDPFKPDEYVSLRLTGNGFNRPVYAYLKRDSEAAKKFSKQLLTWESGDYAEFRVILELKFIQKISLSTILEVTDIKGSSWLEPIASESPDDSQ